VELEKRLGNLKGLGFIVHSPVLIPGETEADNRIAAKALRIAIESFRESAGDDDLLIIYYAGHGMLQADNRSYWVT
jgi:hypothetical protein